MGLAALGQSRHSKPRGIRYIPTKPGSLSTRDGGRAQEELQGCGLLWKRGGRAEAQW